MMVVVLLHIAVVGWWRWVCWVTSITTVVTVTTIHKVLSATGGMQVGYVDVTRVRAYYTRVLGALPYSHDHDIHLHQTENALQKDEGTLTGMNGAYVLLARPLQNSPSPNPSRGNLTSPAKDQVFPSPLADPGV